MPVVPWGCKSRSTTPTLAPRSMPPSKQWLASDPMRSLSGALRLNGRHVQLAQLAAFHQLPAITPLRDYAEAGGLMSYGSNIVDSFRQAGVYVGRILKGAKPAELPIVQSNKFELVINAQTARMLGLTVPTSLLGRANDVID